MKLYIGTSGWMYKDWNGKFYPKELKSNDQLPYYAKHFKTVEVNSTFYHMPQAKSVQRWYDVTPADFVFTIKLSRYLTHTKRLVPDEPFDDYLREFMERLQPLNQKLGVILVQLPPSLRRDHTRLKYLARLLNKHAEKLSLNFVTAIEFRHASWFTPEVFYLLNQLDISNVIIDSPGRWPANTQITGSAAYIRFHGGKDLYRSSYSDDELKKWADFIKTKAAKYQQVYVYFNNDYNAVAVANAKTLIKLCQ
jgi:uncharacterized protein YecE (DUF72 family)